MIDNNYWKNYVHGTDTGEIERAVKKTIFKSRGLNLNLTYFEKGKNAPNILCVPGSGCYGLYYAELLYNMHTRGYNVFVIDFQGHGDSSGARGDFTVSEILENCRGAVKHIADNFNGRIGVFGGSFGGFITFYLGLSDGNVKSIVCQNPAVLTEKEFQKEVTKKVKKILPLLRIIAWLFPRSKIPTILYIDQDGFIKTDREKIDLEKFTKDPNIVSRYTFRAALSQITTPPPKPLETLKIPVMFLAPSKDNLMTPSYVKNLYDRIAPAKKKFVEVDGGHLWLVSSPREAAKLVCDWFGETI